MKKILVVDDEKPISDIIKFNLEKEGYEIVTAFDGEEALEKVEEESPDLIVLDVMLPKIDGLEVVREVRKKHSMPIIMVTAKETEIDKVLGLELGADDYVAKPFLPSVLYAKCKAILNRLSPHQEDIKQFGAITIDYLNHIVCINQKQISLTHKEYLLLELFTKNCNL